MRNKRRRNKKREEFKEAALLFAMIDGLFAFLLLAGLFM